MALSRSASDRFGAERDGWTAGLLARCTFPAAGTKVTCAVSGGADSLALLALAVAAGCEVTAAHVDHGLRPGSAQEAAVVRAAADQLGAAFAGFTVQVTLGPNLEARARAARYAVLPDGVLTGHTADDQAETVLLNLLRGSGLDGIAAIDPARRPLLALRRAETAAVCARLGWSPVSDPSNADPVHRRNRVRHEVLPLLADVAARDPVPLLARLAQLARDDVAVLDAMAAVIDPTDATALNAAPRPLARRAVRAWLTGEHPPSSAAVERVLAVARGEAVACEIEGGRTVRRRAQRLSVTGPSRENADNVV